MFSRTFKTLPVALLLIGFPGAARPAEPLEVQSPMDADPRIVEPEVTKTFDQNITRTWLQALAHPEVDLRRQVAHVIAKAHRRGATGLDRTIEPLIEVLEEPDQHPLVRLACTRTLITLDADQAAPLLFEQSRKGGIEMAQLVEPALARWDYEPARSVWLERLEQQGVSRRLRVLAIRGLARVKESRATAPLRTLALSPTTMPDVRLEAARAVGRLQSDGLLDDARRLAADRSPRAIVDRLVAASLLRTHSGAEAEQFLKQLGVDPQPAVAAIALERLLEIDPAHVVELADRTVQSPDANVRHLTARGLAAVPSVENIEQLGPLLDDVHPDVRNDVRKSLIGLTSDPQLLEPVLSEAREMLATDKWRGLEQAALLLTALDHKPSVDRLVELLDFPRAEVGVTTAWALRRLAVPETLPAMLEHAKLQTVRIVGSRNPESDAPRLQIDTNSANLQTAQLFQAFGQMQYAPAEPVMRKRIPKSSPFSTEARAAAIWGLGYIHAGDPDPELAELFSGRLSDLSPFEPEADRVRHMAAVSLGRMQAREFLPVLREFYEFESANSDVGYACGWAIHQITGEGLPEPEPIEIGQSGWFLTPVGD